MNIQQAIDLIKQFEGLRLKAYLDPVGVPTIGYGHTCNVKMSDTITREKAEDLLKLDLEPLKMKLDVYDSIYHWNENEYCALLSFMYNLGSGSLDQVTNKGKRSKSEISEKMQLYYNACGRPLPGLITRRQKEYELFIKKPSITETAITEQTTLGEIVNMIYQGRFGNGEERKNNLYKTIQNLVNNRR